jgi:putative flippase GtrA
MKEREIKTSWVAATAVAASAGFVVLGMMLGSSPLGWNIHVVSASAILAAILATGSVFLWSAWKKKQDARAGYPAKDERTRLQERRAAYYTVFICVYLMLAMLWYNFLGVNLLDLRAPNATQTIIASILAIAASFAGSRWYYLHGGKARWRALE